MMAMEKKTPVDRTGKHSASIGRHPSFFQGNRTNLYSTLALATRVYCSRATNRPVGTKEMTRDAVGTPTTKK